MSSKAYLQLKEKAVLDLLDKFPDHPSHTLSKILYRDNPLLFRDVEAARNAIRYRRGANGVMHRKCLKDKKYVRQQQSI